MSEAGHPRLVDFGASFTLARRIPWLRMSLMRIGAEYDSRAVSKLKSAVAPHLMNAADWQRLEAPLPFESLVERAERELAWARRWALGHAIGDRTAGRS
jgi:hypothetical protein